MSENFQEAAQFVQQAFEQTQPTEERTKGKNDLIIWGGQFEAGSLTDFLTAWGKTLDQLAWRMIESVSSFAVKKNDGALYNDEDDAERLRLFGETGDLDIRRDGHHFYWRFIGNSTGRWPTLDDYLEEDGDFFAVHEQFHVVTEYYYQWRGGDARVGLDLSPYFPQYGHGRQAPGIYLKQEHYLVDGRIAFVRYVGFEPKQVASS